MIRDVAHHLLDNPLIFELQQQFSNDYQNLKDTFSEYFSVSGKNILDVGCSTAACASRVVNMKENKYVGVDIDEKYIELARRRHPDGCFYTQDARSLPFKSDFFDLVMFNGVWHHMDDDLIRACMLEVHRVLRPSGIVVVSEPVFRYDWWLSTWFLRNDRGKFIRDRASYRALLDGFKIIQEKTLRISLHEFAGFAAQKVTTG